MKVMNEHRIAELISLLNSNNTLVDKHYDEIQIGSIYWEEKVEFENPEIAVLNFFEEKW